MTSSNVRALRIVKSHGWQPNLAWLCSHTNAPTPVTQMQGQLQALLSQIGVRSNDELLTTADVLEARGRVMKVETGGFGNLPQPKIPLTLVREAAQPGCTCAVVRFYFWDVPRDTEGALTTCESAAALLRFGDGTTVELVLRYRRLDPQGWNECDALDLGISETFAQVLWPRDVTPDFHPHHLCLRVAGHTLRQGKVVRIQGQRLLYRSTSVDVKSATTDQGTYSHLLPGERPFHARLGVAHKLLENYDDSFGTDNLYTLLRYSGYVPWGSARRNRMLERLLLHLGAKNGRARHVDLTILVWTTEDEMAILEAREREEEDSDNEPGVFVTEEKAHLIGRVCSLVPRTPPSLCRPGRHAD